MKQAFTMIELIFVIVILGVLAAVAIPKFNATRNNAKIAVMSQTMAMAATDIAGYAISQGTIEQDLRLMSNGIKTLVDRGEATVDLNGSASFRMGSEGDCLNFKVVDGDLDANLTLEYGSGIDSLCRELQTVFDAKEYPIPLKGPRVKY